MSAITESARGEDCTVRLILVCNRDKETTVWAHSNTPDGGKARGKKLISVDHIGAYACSDCHMVYDRQVPRPAGMSKEYVDAAFAKGRATSEEKLKAKGLWPDAEQLEGRRIERNRWKNKSSKLVAANRSFLSRQLLGKGSVEP